MCYAGIKEETRVYSWVEKFKKRQHILNNEHWSEVPWACCPTPAMYRNLGILWKSIVYGGKEEGNCVEVSVS